MSLIEASRLVLTVYPRDSQIHEQISVLNRDFNETGLSFELLDIVRTPNANWFDFVGEQNKRDREMKTALRRGDVTTLNIYTVGFTHDSELLGYATFPVNSTVYFIDDGIVLNYRTLPNGTYNNFNKGRTLTHEVGHWVGLYHTFEGGCSEPGDYVDDTPAEAYPARKCEPRDSCPNRTGPDRKELSLPHLRPLLLTYFVPSHQKLYGLQQRYVHGQLHQWAD